MEWTVQYSVLKSGKAVLTLPALEKITNVFEVDISQQDRKINVSNEDIN
jgi:hypothetical protein